jgi:hypothetical protein
LEVEMTDLFAAASMPLPEPAKEPRKNQTVLEEYMTRPETCHALNIPSHVLKYAIEKRKLELFAVNGRIKVKTREVMKFLDMRSKEFEQK